MSTIFGKKILITGGGGFIGSHLAQKLYHDNELTLCDQRFTSLSHFMPSMLNHSNVLQIQADVTNFDSLEELTNEYDYIIHLAGILGVQKVVQKPVLTADVNYQGTRNLLKVARRQNNLSKFIFFSTSEVFGNKAESVSEEDDLMVSSDHIRWSYAAHKLAGEFLCRSYGEEYKIDISIVRPFNVYGEYRLGANAITNMVNKALSNQDIEVFGSGKETRSWCHVSDFVEAVIRLLSEEKLPILNVGNNDNSVSSLELAQLIKKLSGSNSCIVNVPSTTPDVASRRPSLDLLHNRLKCFPKVSLEEGVLKTIHWIREQNVGSKEAA